jgi:hypothetical protein
MRDTPPNHYWASTVRDSWLDVSWGIGCIFVSPNPHPAFGYMKQKPALVWPMDLAPTMQGNLPGDQYIRDVLQPVVVPHFDNHPLATRPVYMDDNARPHRSRAVTTYLQNEAVIYVPWPAMSPDLNPIEHIWDMLRPSYTGWGISCAPGVTPTCLDDGLNPVSRPSS